MVRFFNIIDRVELKAVLSNHPIYTSECPTLIAKNTLRKHPIEFFVEALFGWECSPSVLSFSVCSRWEVY